MALIKLDNDQKANETLKPKTRVLDEETYEQSLDKIIQRDFFPELNKLRVQSEYLEATENNDVERLREISARYNVSQTPNTRIATPATFETPNTDDGSPHSNREPQPVCTTSPNEDINQVTNQDPSEATLDKFLAKHTSEDNESFEQIMEQARLKQRQKYSWLYKKEEEQLQNSENRLALCENKQGDQLMLEDRPAMIDTWKYKNKNALMYCPEGIEYSVKEKIENKSKPQEVQHVNTRFTKNPFPDESCSGSLVSAAAAAAKQANQQGKVGVDGLEQNPTGSPHVNGFGFVAATPVLEPGVDASPLMTWGSIDGTPFRLDAGDTPRPNTPGQVFKMPEPKKREQIGLALAEKVSRKHREKTRQARAQAAAMIGKSPSSRLNTVERLNTMSPAAQRLASQRLGIKTGTDKALLASYTPRSDRMTTPSPYTPRTPTTPKQINTPSREVSLTDNLLKLPKR